MMVFSGLPVWPSVLYQLVIACDHQVYLDRCMGQVDFVVLLLKLWSVGAWLLDDVKEGCIVAGACCIGALAHAGEAHDKAR